MKFINGHIKQFIPREGSNVLAQVEFTDGQVLPADIAIIGIGTTFYTDWMKGSPIQMNDNGTVLVNKVTCLFIILRVFANLLRIVCYFVFYKLAHLCLIAVSKNECREHICRR